MDQTRNNSVKFEKQDWQLAIVLLIALLSALGAHLVTLETLNELESSGKEIMGVYDGTESLRSLDRHLIELVNVQNRYLASGADTLLQKADQSMRGIQKDLGDIQRIFKNEQTGPYLVELDSLVQRKMAYHRNLMEVARREAVLGQITLPQLGPGEKLRDSILETTDLLRHYHRRHMLNYLDNKNDLSSKLLKVSLGSLAFVFLVAVFSIYYLMRTAHRRRELHNNLVDAKDHAVRAALLKEQFIANMSHEIRTPLNAIIGFSNLLDRTRLDGNQPEFVHSIRTSSENLLTIINDILDFSKIEAGALRLESIPFNLPALIHSVENMFRYREKESNLDFQVHLDEDGPELLLGDPTRLTQILVNLLGNAFKFTEQGEVSLRVSATAGAGSEVQVRFLVKDSGIGIPEEKLKAIFDRFAQGSSDTTRKYGGAGLGLTITRQLVEIQGGTIEVASTQGAGTTFQVEIPYREADQSEIRTMAAPSPRPKPETSTVRILLVEDNPMNQRVAELLLDGWGFEHDHAANGRIALEMLANETYDLILMDIQMPEMDGYSTSRKIREEMNLKVPIIATTAHAFAGEREKCLQNGMNEYISKPLNEEELLRLLLLLLPPQPPVSAEVSTLEAGIRGFDKAYILEVAQGDPETLQEMATIFLSQTAKELRDIEDGLVGGHLNQVTASAHSMKSTVAYMGFGASLGQSLAQFESQAREAGGVTEALWEKFGAIKAETEAAAGFIRKEFLEA